MNFPVTITVEKLKEIAPNFDVREFVHPEMYARYGDMSLRFIHPALFYVAQGIRDHFKSPVRINTWHYAKPGEATFTLSGFRPWWIKFKGMGSAHRRGMAIDIKIDGIPSSEVQKAIIEQYEEVFRAMGVTAMELDTEGWTHVSVENFGVNYLVKIPKPRVSRGEQV